MKHELLKLMCCPECHSAFELLDCVERDNEIESGVLVCQSCDARYPVDRGLPVILSDAGRMARTQRSFGKQWEWQNRFLFETDTIYGLSENEELSDFEDAMGLRLSDARNGFILDAGCGSGRLTRGVARAASEATVVGMDISGSARVAYENCRDTDNAHIVRCDLRKPPFRPGTFGYVWSEGVIHHTPSSYETFSALDTLVAPGGRTYIWVYPSYKFSPYRFARDVLWRPYKLPLSMLLALSWLLAVPLYIATLLTNQRRGRYGKRTLRSMAFAFFDNLSPEFQHRHSKAEVSAWLESHGYAEISIRGNLGVCGRKLS